MDAAFAFTRWIGIQIYYGLLPIASTSTFINATLFFLISQTTKERLVYYWITAVPIGDTFNWTVWTLISRQL